jgi:WD40 repeat protein
MIRWLKDVKSGPLRGEFAILGICAGVVSLALIVPAFFCPAQPGPPYPHHKKEHVSPPLTVAKQSLVLRIAAFTPDGRSILTAASDHTYTLWDVESGNKCWEKKFPQAEYGPLCLASSPDGTRALTGNGGTAALLLRVTDGAVLRSLEGHEKAVSAVAFSSDGKKALTGSDDPNIKLWDLDSAIELREMGGHWDAILSLAFLPGDDKAVSGNADGTIRTWNLNSGLSLEFLQEHERMVKAISLSRHGETLLSSGDDGVLRVWDTAAWKVTKRMSDAGRRFYASAISPDGLYALSGDSLDNLQLWDVRRGALLSTLAGHRGMTASVGFSSDGRLAVSAGGASIGPRYQNDDQRTLIIWEIPSGKPVRVLLNAPDPTLPY